MGFFNGDNFYGIFHFLIVIVLLRAKMIKFQVKIDSENFNHPSHPKWHITWLLKEISSSV